MSAGFLALKQKRNGSLGSETETSRSSLVAASSSTGMTSRTLYPELDDALFEIRDTKDAGRSLFARKTFKAGAILLQVDPHVAILDKAHLPILCSKCMLDQPEVTLRRCSSCKVVYYCSEVGLAVLAFATELKGHTPNSRVSVKTGRKIDTSSSANDCKRGPMLQR